MSVACNEHGKAWKFCREGSDRVGEIVSAPALLQPHMAGQYDGVSSGLFCRGNRFTHRFVGMIEAQVSNKIGSKPKRHSGRGDSDDRYFDPGDFFQDV